VPRLPRPWVLFASFALVGCAPAPPASLQKARTDLYGDPLPPGAVARIGTTRFRHGSGAVHVVAFSPDGKTLATSSGDGIRLWDRATGKEVRRTRGERLNVNAIAFRPDGKGVIAIGTPEKPSDLWSWTWGADPQRLPIPERPNFHLAALSPDGRFVVAFVEKAAYLLEAATGKEIAELSGAWRRAAFSADGKTFVTQATEPGDILILWDATTGKELGRVPDGAGGKGNGGGQRFADLASVVALSPDGKLAAGAYYDEDLSVRFWDTASGKELRSVRASGVAPRRMAFSPDGRVLALASQNDLHLWDVTTGRELWHYFYPNFFSVAFAPDGRTVAAGLGAMVRMWDVATGRELVPAPGQRDPIGFVRLSPDGRTVTTTPALASEDGPNDRATRFRYWEARTGMELAPRQGQAQKFPPLNYLGGDADLSADGKTFAVRGNDGAVHLWDVASGKELHRIAYEGEEGHWQFSPDGKLLLVQGFDRKAPEDSAAKGGLWEVETGKPLGELVTSGGRQVFSPDGKVLASWCLSDGSVSLLDMSTRRQLHRLAAAGRPIMAFAFSPDGKTLVGIYHQRPEIRMWDVATGKEKAALAAWKPDERPGLHVERLAFSPDGKWLVGGASGGTVFFWDAATGALRQEVATGHSFLVQLAFSADGKLLLTSDYETGLVWDVQELLQRSQP
jgi:WD40 repeat protein